MSKPSCPPIQVVSISEHCIHLRVNPQTPNSWILLIVFASPHRNQREATWRELSDMNSITSEPWCIAGEFNQVFYAHEKQGGVPFSAATSASFANCINDCHLIDLGYKGQPFTWKRGDLREQLDRVLCTQDWQAMFPNCSVTHLPLMSSDHCGLWVRNVATAGSSKGNSYFKFLAPWLDHPAFEAQVRSSWIDSEPWAGNMQRLTKNLKQWNRDCFGHIFKHKQRLIKRLEGIGNILMREDISRVVTLRNQLWNEYNQLIKHEETYWFQLPRHKCVTLGDKNSRFFHQAALPGVDGIGSWLSRMIMMIGYMRKELSNPW